MHQLNVCWNNAYRRIFYYNSLESVKDLQYYCGRLDFNHIYFKCKLTFLHALCDLDNLVVHTCFSVFKRSQEFYDISSDFNYIADVFSVVELKMCFSAFSKVALKSFLTCITCISTLFSFSFILYLCVSVNFDIFFTFSTVTNTRGHKYMV